MNYQPKDYETARRSLCRKMLPGILILIILVICIILMLERKNAPVPPAGTQQPAGAAHK